MRHLVVSIIDLDRWTALTQSLVTLEEYGSRRDQEGAMFCLDFAPIVHNLRTRRGFHHDIIWGKPMAPGDFCAKEPPGSSMCIAAAGYGDLVPTSEAMEHILGSAQKGEKNQRDRLHLTAAMARAEVGSRSPPPPSSRVLLVARSLRLMEAKQVLLAKNPIMKAKSRCGDELISFRHDDRADPHGRDYRSL